MTEIAAAGATPAVDGATPSQTPGTPATAQPAASTPPATGEPDANGLTTDAGREALRRERERAESAERELAKLRRSTQTDSERAVADAKAAGITEATEKLTGSIRRSEVKAALLSAGVDGTLVDIASRADQFATLKVTDDGSVEGLDAAVEAFKRATPTLFTKPAAPRPTDSGLGPRGAPSNAGTDLNTWIRKEAGRA